MKLIKFFAAAILCTGLAANAHALGAAGCGLGSLVFNQNDFAHQLLAATTNGTFGSQTFGITFGTSNCTNKGLINISMERQSFIEANFADLSRDVAAGQGEFVENLAKLYNVSDTKAFASTLQQNHAVIFASNAQNAVNQINLLAARI